MTNVRGHEARQGETAFAFVVLRMRELIDREGLVELIRYLALLVPDAEGFVEGMPETIEEEMRYIGVPWTPPEAGHAVEAQRRLIEGAEVVGVEAAWFFQTGTSLGGDEDEAGEGAQGDDDDDDEGASENDEPD